MIAIPHGPRIASFLQSAFVLSLWTSNFCFSSVPEGRGSRVEEGTVLTHNAGSTYGHGTRSCLPRWNSFSFRAGSKVPGFIPIHPHPVLSTDPVWGKHGCQRETAFFGLTLSQSFHITASWRMSSLKCWIPHWVWDFSLFCCCWTWFCFEVYGCYCYWGLDEIWQVPLKTCPGFTRGREHLQCVKVLYNWKWESYYIQS